MQRIEAIAQAHPAGILLREKDLPEGEYKALAEQVMVVCARYDVLCILHHFADAALALDCPAFHAPLPVLRAMSAAQRTRFFVLGASCHSVEEAREAEQLGCTYLTAGHIFATGCKAGLPGRGLNFLREVCRSVSIPVYAIGGIYSGNYTDVLRAGAKGVCVMSGPMQCGKVSAYFNEFKKAGDGYALE